MKVHKITCRWADTSRGSRFQRKGLGVKFRWLEIKDQSNIDNLAGSNLEMGQFNTAGLMRERKQVNRWMRESGDWDRWKCVRAPGGWLEWGIAGALRGALSSQLQL